MKNEITFTIAKDIIDLIRNNKDNILDIIESEKNQLSKSTKKHYVYSENDFLFFLSAIYNRTIIKQYSKKGLNQNYLTMILGLSSRLKTVMYTKIAIQLNLIERFGKAIIGYSSFDYRFIFNDNLNYDITEEITVIKNKVKNVDEQTGIETFSNDIFVHISDENEVDLTVDINNVNYKKTLNLLKEQINTKINNITNLLLSLKNTKSDKKKKIKLTQQLLAYKYQLTKMESDVKNINNKRYFRTIQKINNRRQFIGTTMKKELREFFLIDGKETVTYDIKNSQPAFFANKYKDEVDVSFYNDSVNGIVYDVIAEKLNITREEAKRLWMLTAYWDQRTIEVIGDEAEYRNINSYKISKIYPKLIALIDKLKVSNVISVNLQNIESSYINPISDLLTENGIPNESIYDEITFKKEDTAKFKELVSQYFEDNNIVLKISRKKNEYNIKEVVTNSDIKIITSNEVKEESNMINQEEKESSLEVVYTKDYYIKLLEGTRTGFFKQSHIIKIKDIILDELVKQQKITISEIAIILKEIM